MTVSKTVLALGCSLLLHAVAVGVLSWSWRSRPAPATDPSALWRSPAGQAPVGFVDVEPASREQRAESEPDRFAAKPTSPSAGIDPRPRPARLPQVAPKTGDEAAPQSVAAAVTGGDAVLPVDVSAPVASAVVATAAPATSARLREAMLEATERSDAPSTVAGFGSLEMLHKEQRLERALTWVLPKSLAEDKTYWQMTPAPLGAATVVVVLSSDGRILEAIVEDTRGSPQLQRLIMRMTRFLSYGRFSSSLSPDENGQIRRRFSVRVSSTIKETAELGAGGDVVRIGFEPPESGKPGRGFVADATGLEYVGLVRELGAIEMAKAPSPVP